jgi:hypothetical protein
MTNAELKRWARQGAAAELAKIYEVFPDLRPVDTPKAPVRKRVAQSRKQRRISDKQRALLSKLMKRRWAAARKAGHKKLM